MKCVLETLPVGRFEVPSWVRGLHIRYPSGVHEGEFIIKSNIIPYPWDDMKFDEKEPGVWESVSNDGRLVRLTDFRIDGKALKIETDKGIRKINHVVFLDPPPKFQRVKIVRPNYEDHRCWWEQKGTCSVSFSFDLILRIVSFFEPTIKVSRVMTQHHELLIPVRGE